MKPTCKLVSGMVVAVGRGLNWCCLTPTLRLPMFKVPMSLEASQRGSQQWLVCLWRKWLQWQPVQTSLLWLSFTVLLSDAALVKWEELINKKVSSFFLSLQALKNRRIVVWCVIGRATGRTRVAGKWVGRGVYIVSRCLVTRPKNISGHFFFFFRVFFSGAIT